MQMKARGITVLMAVVVLALAGCGLMEDVADRAEQVVDRGAEVPTPTTPAPLATPPASAFPASGSGAKLIVGVGRKFEPMYDFTGPSPAGFDAELARELATLLGKSGVDFRSGNRLLPRAAAGEVDLSIGALSIRQERLATNDFSKPYLAQEFVVVASRAGLTRQGLGRHDCVLGGSGIYKPLLDGTGCSIIATTTTARALERVAAGEAAFTVVDSVYLADLPAGAFKTDIALGKDVFGVALMKGNTTLKDAVDAALDSMERDGFLEFLRRRYGV